MLTKKNPEESFEQAKLPYFNPDHIRDAINDRVKEEKENYRQRHHKE